ncbi:27 kDa hemolymph protein-like [Aricia agestis]|uniref:27 kDa hemolymph protein-like n=1 Tax=Aricia agestis TaxID=91739 RepID=UPI001C201BC8|nr:27 kDa hemolymph protein-like [Aricia agestis]
MIWKAILVAVLAVGVLAEYELTDAQRQQMRELLRQTCKKNGNEDKADAVEATVKNFAECVKTLFNPDTIKQEIEAAKPNGELDEVFKKYCAKSPQLKTCIHTLTTGVTPCLDAKVRDHIAYVDNSTDSLIDFLCYRDGDRIAMFIAEHGPECMQTKTSDIRECANKMREGISSLDDAKSLTLEQQCGKFDELASCVVKALEGCESDTPSNMVQSLFNYIKKGSPCKK